MNFAYGVIAAVGVLIAISLGLIAADPGYLVDPAEVMDDPALELAAETSVPPIVSIPSGTSSPQCAETDECYVPFELSVNAGVTVTWSNDDVAAHTVTSGTVDMGFDGMFDSGLFPPGKSFDHTFESAGEYDYFCLVHPWMVGKIYVA